MPADPAFVRETREALHMSRQVFAFEIGMNPRTLERWEQGRSKPNPGPLPPGRTSTDAAERGG